MEYCYQSQLPSCFTFPFHLNLLRIMNSLHGVHEILCGNGTDNLKGKKKKKLFTQNLIFND